MFVLVSIEDPIKVNPDQFDEDLTEVLLQQIEIKYVNKILVNVGLCVCFYDFIEVGDPYIYPAEGCAHQRAKFRLVVFRPFVGEVIVGKVLSCREDGIKVSLDFFDDITIPTYLLQAPSEYKFKQWIWKFSEDESNPIEFSIQAGDKIRFRIRSITFAAVTSTVKGTTATVTTESQIHHSSSQANDSSSANQSHGNTEDEFPSAPQAIRKRSTSFDVAKDVEPPAAMQIIASINEDGLGLPSWWD